MKFLLSDDLAADIVVAMENQDTDMVIDTELGEVRPIGDAEDGVSEEELEDEDRYIPIPPWDSSDGYDLMDDFVSSVRDPLARSELRAALQRGHGVFKAFKAALTAFPETEKKWFVFKEGRLMRAVHFWYDDLRESWGLERLKPDPDDFDMPAGLDLQMRNCEGSDLEAVKALIDPSIEATFEDYPPQVRAYLAAGLKHSLDAIERPDSVIVVASTLDGEAAAFLWALRRGGALVIRWLAVDPRYADSGIESELLSFFQKEHGRDSGYLIIDIPGIDGLRLDAICGSGWLSCGPLRYKVSD